MNTPLVRAAFASKSSDQPPTLKGVLQKLDIAPFTPQSVAEYKREKLEEVMHQLLPPEAEEIKEDEFSNWEYGELDRLQRKIAFRDPGGDAPVIRFWHRRLPKTAKRHLAGDAPMIRFWKTPMCEHFYTYLQWVRAPLEDFVDVPGFVKAKADEIANRLPDATSTVEAMRSELRVYDPFLIVSYGDESYHVEVWAESEFERRYT